MIMANLNNLIRMGADKALVSAVMAKESRCVAGSIKGSPVRVILKFGKAECLMGTDAEILEAVRASIGGPRTEIRLLRA
jgi:hypothetical protein